MKRVFSIILLMSSLSYLVVAMEQKPELVKIQVKDKIYELTLKQAQQSEKLQEILKKHTDVEEPIILPYSIAPEVFDYIYKDLQSIEFDSSLLDDKMIGDLYNASVDLKIPWLQEKYTDITVDRITDITLEVGDKKYHLTAEQAKRSKTLKNTLSDVEDYTVPIPLPDALENVFEYIYDDLTHKEYDSDVLNIETLVDLVNAANYLDISQLLQDYQDLLIERLTDIDAKNIEIYINALQRLPVEMQIPLSQYIGTKSLKIFESIPQSYIIKQIPEREYNYKKTLFSPDASKMILQDATSIQLIDLANNKTLWKKNQEAQSILFSSDSSKVAVNNQSMLRVFNVQDGKEFLNKKLLSAIKILDFFSAIDGVIVQDIVSKEMLLIDAATGDLLLESSLSEDIVKCYYDSDSQSLCLRLVNAVLVVDIKSGQIIKTKAITNLEDYSISPDGKKIISLSNELIRVENSFNEEGNFSWELKKPSKNFPEISSFSKDKRLVALVSHGFGTSDVQVFILNMVTGETLFSWVQPELEFSRTGQLTSFSPEAHWVVLQGSYSITAVNLGSKKVITKGFSKYITSHYYISDDTIALFFGHQGKVIFYNVQADKVIAATEDIEGIESIQNLDFKGVLKNNLFVSLLYGVYPLNTKIVCFDIFPLVIFTFLNQPYISLDQALITYYILKMIQNDLSIIIPSDLEIIYDELPKGIKKLEKDHNRKFIEDASKENPEALKKFKRIKIE